MVPASDGNAASVWNSRPATAVLSSRNDCASAASSDWIAPASASGAAGAGMTAAAPCFWRASSSFSTCSVTARVIVSTSALLSDEAAGALGAVCAVGAVCARAGVGAAARGASRARHAAAARVIASNGRIVIKTSRRPFSRGSS